MLTETRFVDLLRDLRQIEKAFPRSEGNATAQGELILDAFLRHTTHTRGAVYLREQRDNSLQLVARSDRLVAPSLLDLAIPDEVLDYLLHAEQFAPLILSAGFEPHPHVLVPLRGSRDPFGIVLLCRDEPGPVAHQELESLRGAAFYLSALMQSQRLTSEMREGDFQLKYRLWELESLYDIGLSIASTLDLDKLADEILIRTLSLLNARSAALFLRRDDRFFLHRAFGEVRSEFLEQEIQEPLAKQLIEEGRPVRFDAAADCIFPGCDSFVAMPIRSGTKVIGVLAAADRELREGGVGAFLENDLRVLSLFANQVAIALENTRLHQQALEKQAMEREIEVAVTIQRDILPRALPEIDGYEIDAFSSPARLLGGDYHAFFERDGNLSICVADVSGKSVPAAILVSAFHAAIQLLFHEGRDLGVIATELNRHIHLWSSENKFITLFVATIDPDSELIHFVNAGHNPAYVVGGGKLDQLESHGLPVGLLSGVRYKTQVRPFPLGSLLVAYSDGITEAENEAEEEFGNGRLESILSGHGSESCSAVKNAIVSGVETFVADAPQKDDETIVLVRTLQKS